MPLLAHQKDTDHLPADYSVPTPENSLHVIFHGIWPKDARYLHIPLPELQHYKNFQPEGNTPIFPSCILLKFLLHRIIPNECHV